MNITLPAIIEKNFKQSNQPKFTASQYNPFRAAQPNSVNSLYDSYFLHHKTIAASITQLSYHVSTVGKFM